MASRVGKYRYRVPYDAQPAGQLVHGKALVSHILKVAAGTIEDFLTPEFLLGVSDRAAL